MASKTFSLLVLTNRGRTECSVKGYPTIAVLGHTARGPVRKVPITIGHGTYFRPDPGPSKVLLAVGQSASCVLETETAYSGGANPITITALVIAPPGTTTRGETVQIGLGATGPPGRPLPILITAFVAGTSGPPQ